MARCFSMRIWQASSARRPPSGTHFVDKVMAYRSHPPDGTTRAATARGVMRGVRVALWTPVGSIGRYRQPSVFEGYLMITKCIAAAALSSLIAAGTAVAAEQEGMSGMSGMEGQKGMSGMSGMEGQKGMSGMSGMEGQKGMSGMSGMEGQKGMSGMSGMEGQKGMSGMSGMEGQKGMSGMSGMEGQKGMSGMSGTQNQESKGGWPIIRK